MLPFMCTGGWEAPNFQKLSVIQTPMTDRGSGLSLFNFCIVFYNTNPEVHKTYSLSWRWMCSLSQFVSSWDHFPMLRPAVHLLYLVECTRSRHLSEVMEFTCLVSPSNLNMSPSLTQPALQDDVFRSSLSFLSKNCSIHLFVHVCVLRILWG